MKGVIDFANGAYYFHYQYCLRTFFTVRMILTIKGYRYIAAAVSMVEVVIYVVGLGLVLIISMKFRTWLPMQLAMDVVLLLERRLKRRWHLVILR